MPVRRGGRLLPAGRDPTMGPQRPPSPPRATSRLLPSDRPGTSPTPPRSPPGPTLRGSRGPLHLPRGTNPLCSRTSPRVTRPCCGHSPRPLRPRSPPHRLRRRATADVTAVPRDTGASHVGGAHSPLSASAPSAQPETRGDITASSSGLGLMPAPARPCTPAVCTSSRGPRGGGQHRPRHDAAVWGCGGPVGTHWN